MRPALKLVTLEQPETILEEGEFWSSDKTNFHSLHSTISLGDSFGPEVPNFFIRQYSQPGQVVMDPFVGRGTTALEACLLGRIVCASDINPLSVKISKALLHPAELTEVTLELQKINFQRPIDLAEYNKSFKPFYDHQTYREIVNLKRYIQETASPVANFLELIALSILHGHSAGFLSVYTFPQISVSSAYQQELNNKRLQAPEYRSAAPRILRKTALVLRDTGFNQLGKSAAQSQCVLADARNLGSFRSASVDLVMSEPPLPGEDARLQDQWLKLWFVGVSQSSLEAAAFNDKSLESWLDFMNQVLLECARVMKPRARLVFDLREVEVGGRKVLPDEELANLVNSSLSRFLHVEKVIINRPRSIKIQDVRKERTQGRVSRVLVLRRK